MTGTRLGVFAARLAVLAALSLVPVLAHGDGPEKAFLNLPARKDAEAGVGGAVLWEVSDSLFGRDLGMLAPDLERRQINEITSLENNRPAQLNLAASNASFYSVPNSTLWGPAGQVASGLPSVVDGIGVGQVGKADGLAGRDVGDGGLATRQESTNRTVYIAITTCAQPISSGNSSQTTAGRNGTVADSTAGQLRMFVSTSQQIQRPGPQDLTSSSVREIILRQGYGLTSILVDPAWTSGLFVGIHAPNVSSEFTGIWNYDMAVSVDSAYFSYSARPFLTLLDSDSSSAVFVTDPITDEDTGGAVEEQWMNTAPPFSLNVLLDPDDPSAINSTGMPVAGMLSSRCGIQSAAQATTDITITPIDRFPDNAVRYQAWVNRLQPGRKYIAALSFQLPGQTTVVGGGGRVWRYVKFSTKSDRNCAILPGLKFCSNVVYATPYNPVLFPDLTVMAATYDERTSGLFSNFTKALAQVQCNATSAARYSLAQTCDDCAAAYKSWLCAAAMPRCDDVGPIGTASTKNMAMRNAGARLWNGSDPIDPTVYGVSEDLAKRRHVLRSRNDWIDDVVQPGPYREMLPCIDQCWAVVRTCPTSMGFACPKSGPSLEWAYGSEGTCNNVTQLVILGSGSPSLRSVSTFSRPALTALVAAVGSTAVGWIIAG